MLYPAIQLGPTHAISKLVSQHRRKYILTHRMHVKRTRVGQASHPCALRNLGIFLEKLNMYAFTVDAFVS